MRALAETCERLLMGKIGEMKRGLGVSLGGQTFPCKHWAPPGSLTDAHLHHRKLGTKT